MLRHRHDLLALKEPAFFRKNLVFEMNGGHAGGLIFPHRALHIQGIAIAGIGIADNRNVHGVGDIAGVGGHFGHGQQPHIGETPFRRRAGSGHIYGVKADGFGNAGVQGVHNKGRDNQPLGSQQLPQAGGGLDRRGGGGNGVHNRVSSLLCRLGDGFPAARAALSQMGTSQTARPTTPFRESPATAFLPETAPSR